MEELIKNTEVEFDGRLNIPDPDKKITARESDKNNGSRVFDDENNNLKNFFCVHR